MINGIAWPIIDKKLIEFINEDSHGIDLSSHLIPNKVVTAKLKAKDIGILAGILIFQRLFKLLDVECKIFFEDGSKIKNNDIIAEVTGMADQILIGERIGLNLLSRMSGIATLTTEYLNAIKSVNSKTKIAATRKTLPGLRLFDKLAVIIAGADTHRFSLQDCIMLKDNHLSLFDSIETAITHSKKLASFSHKIEVECSTVEMAESAIVSGADIIMLDNFDIENAKRTINFLKDKYSDKKYYIELSGNITLENISNYAKVGADIISSGAITHSVKAFDFSLKFGNKL